MDSKNLYIHALEYGAGRMDTGVTLAGVLEYLTEKKAAPPTAYKLAFAEWFFSTFTSGAILNSNDLQTRVNYAFSTDQQYINATHYLKAEGYFQLQDYYKLQQTRKDAADAQKLARWSIWISIGLGLITLYFQANEC